MKAISVFKKAAIPALVLLLILAMTVSIIPVVSADSTDVPKIANTSLAISGDINLVTYFTPEDELKDSDYVKVTVPTQDGGEKVIKTTVARLNATMDKGRWVVKAPLAAAQLTDTVTITWYKDGTAIATYERCAKTDYIDQVFAKIEDPETPAKTVAALKPAVAPLKSLLNYGAMAQTMFNHNTESMANADLSADYNPTYGMSADNFYDAVANSTTSDNSEGTIEFTGTEVFLQSSIRLSVYFNAPEGAQAFITDDPNYAGDKENSSKVAIHKDSKGYYVNITNIASFNLDKQFYVTVSCGDKFATASVSVLGYAKKTASNYKAHVSNTFKALYQYYTQTKVYTDNEYKPGPKNQICTHTRTYIDGNDIVCSDCHKSLDKPTLSFKAETIELIKGVEQEVQFTINIAGKNTLQAIIVTPTPMMTDGVTPADGVTLTYKEGSLHVVNAESGLDGEVGLNIVLDAETAMDGCEVVTLTYNVTASESGTYKIGLKTRDAIDANGNAVDGVIASNAEIVVKEPACKEHNFGYEVFANNHRAFCDTCKRVFDIENHAYAAEKKYSSTKLVVNSEICKCGKESENNVKNTYNLGFSVAKDENTKEDVKTTKAPLFLLTPQDLLGVSGSNLGEKVLSEDGDYVTFHNSTKLFDDKDKDGNPIKVRKEGHFSVISKDQGETGRYIAIKYRTTYNKPLEWFVGANNGQTEPKGGENFVIPQNGVFVPNGEWQVMILDLAALKPNHYMADDDGKYRADYIRFDILNEPSAEDQTVDIAYIAMSDDIMSLASFADNDVYRFSASRSDSNAVGTYMGSTKTLNPVFDAYWIRYSTHEGGNTLGFGTDAANGNLPYTSITGTGNKSDCYVTLVANTTYPAYTSTSENKYFVVLYKGSEHQSTFLEGWASSNKSFANNTGEKFLSGGPLFQKDSYWHFGIYNMASAYQGNDVDWLNGEGVAYVEDETKDGVKDPDGNYFDSTLGLSMLRFDYYNNTTEFEGERICDLAFFGVFDTQEQAYKYLNENYLDYLKSCRHDAISDYKSDCQRYCEICGDPVGEPHVYPTVWSVVEGRGEDGKLYESRTCTLCGEIEKREMFFYSNFDSIMVNGKVTNPSASNDKQSGYLKKGKYAFGSYSAADNFNNGAGTNYTVSNDLKLYGWVAVNGGVDRIVFKIGDGAWQNTTGTVKADTGGIKNWITNNLKDVDLTSTVSACNFQGGVAVPAEALQAHAGETVTITFAYVPKANPGTADDPNALIFAEVTNMFIACDHSRNANTYTFDASNPQKFSATCSICGETAYQESDVTDKGLMFFGPEFFAGNNINSNTSVELKTDGNTGMVYARYTANTAFTSEQNLYLFNNTEINRMNSGNVVAFLYRTTASNVATEIFIRGNTATLSSTHGKSVSIDKCGEWRLAVVAKNSTWNSSTGINTLRLDIFNGTVSKGTTFDIAYLACFEDAQAAWGYFGKYAAAYSKGEDAWCNHPHNAVQHVWDSEAKVYKNTCPCGEILPDTDMIYKSEAQKVDGTGYTATQENGITKYTVKSGTSSGTDFYTHIYQSTANVTGDYAVIKYRLTNNGKDANNRSWYAGTAASGYTSARGGNVSDASNTRIVTLTGDGQWHYIIVSFTDTNKAYVKNSDGTYTWSYLRIGFNPSKYDDSVYLEIDEIAFADCYEAASVYMYTHDTQDYFVVNLDKGHCTLNGQTTVTESVRSTANKSLVIDGSAFTLKSPTGLTLGGWCVTPDGVKQYGYRVTSVDGVAQENPVLFSTFTGSNSESTNTGITNVGVSQGYIMSQCRLGAGFQGKKAADLIAYSGKTVNLELVAVTTYGNIIPLVKINNIAVPTMYNSYIQGNHFVDATNVKDNATITGGIVSSVTNKIVFDLSDVAVNPKSTFKMNGWVTTNGGIATYKYRVIEGDNTYEVDATGTIRTTSDVTADGTKNGFDEDCAKNGIFGDLAFSLADVKDANGVAVDLAGKTITVQMIAVTNSGVELSIASFNNVAVKQDIKMFVNSSYAGKQLTQQAGHYEHFIFDESHPDYATLFPNGNIPTSSKAEYLGCVYFNGWGGLTIGGEDVTISDIAFRVKDKEGNVIGNDWYTQFASDFKFTNKSEAAIVSSLGAKLPGATAYTFKGYADLDIVEGVNANDLVDVEFAFIYVDANGNTQYLSFLTLTNVLKST